MSSQEEEIKLGNKNMEADWREGKLSFSEQLNYYVTTKNPHWLDVTFSVGPEQEKISGLKIALVVSSPVFEQLLSPNVVQENSQAPPVEPSNSLLLSSRRTVIVPNRAEAVSITDISFPNYKPKVFRIFLGLLPPPPADLFVEMVKSLKLSNEELLHLLWLTREFQMKEMETNLKYFVDPFIRNFDAFMTEKAFLQLPRECLEQILSSDELPVKESILFENVYRWARNQCSNGGLEITGENVRTVLGSCLQQIRFPLMNSEEFLTTVCSKNVLKEEEKLILLTNIVLRDNKKKGFDMKSTGFNGKPRKRAPCVPVETIIFSKSSDGNASLPSDGHIQSTGISTSERVALQSIGFQGPIGQDCFYHVEVVITNFYDADLVYGRLSKRVWAEKQQIFYVHFDHPITLRKYNLTPERKSRNWYKIEFSLKGGDTQVNSRPIGKEYTDISNGNGIKFRTLWESKQLAAIQFEKLPVN